MHSRKFTTLVASLAIGAVGLTAASPTLALGDNQVGRGGAPRLNFEKIDANSDGQITADEVAQYRNDQFDLRDTNADGYLTSDELTASIISRAKLNAAKRVQRLIKKRDSNGDGRISLAELPGDQGSQRLFRRFDTNGDGVISTSEFSAAKKGLGRKKHFAPVE